MLAQYWAESIVKAEKRARQVDFIFLNEDTKKDKWFYFDMVQTHAGYRPISFTISVS